MNGSGHLAEDFSQPMHLCPIDLRKLQTLVGFDVRHRYNELKTFYETHKMSEEVTWICRRLALMSNEKNVSHDTVVAPANHELTTKRDLSRAKQSNNSA